MIILKSILMIGGFFAIIFCGFIAVCVAAALFDKMLEE